MAAPRVRALAFLAIAALGFGCSSKGNDPSGGSGGSNASHSSGGAGPSAGTGGGSSSAGSGGAGPSAGSGGTSSGSGGTGVPVGSGGIGAAGGGTASGGSPGAAGSPGGNADGGAADLFGDLLPDLLPDRPVDLSADLAPGGPAKIVLVAGTGTGGDRSSATSAQVLNPYGTVVDPISGEVYISEVDTGKIRRIDANGVITTVVGPGAAGAAGNIKLNQPHDLLFQPGTRTLFIADTMNGGMYRLDAASGDVTAFVGPGAPFPGVTQLYCLALSPGGTDLYYTAPNEVRVVDLQAMVARPSVTYAAARVIAIDSKGTLYAVKDRPNGNVLQTVDAAGKATDLPGTSGVVSDPKHITIDPDDNVLIADTELFLIRKYVVATKTLVTLAGTGVSGTGTLDGAPEKAQFKRPHGIFADKMGIIYISDSENNRVLKIVH